MLSRRGVFSDVISAPSHNETTTALQWRRPTDSLTGKGNVASFPSWPLPDRGGRCSAVDDFTCLTR
jgi:hypothetical protein